jgi:26S proteasome regulatory subunit T5
MLELLNQLDGFGSDENIKVRVISSASVSHALLCTCFLCMSDMQVIAATNRADILDPALMRSGRLDRKVEFPHPNEDARSKILQIHSRKMNVAPDVNFDELARSTDDFNAAQLKVRAKRSSLCLPCALLLDKQGNVPPILFVAVQAVCVEAGMLALRRDALEVNHEDFNEGIVQVQAKKKASLNYYA